MISFTDVIESRVDLADLALMNELLDLQHYNNRLLQEAQHAPAPAPGPGPGPGPERPGGDFYVPAGFRR